MSSLYIPDFWNMKHDVINELYPKLIREIADIIGLKQENVISIFDSLGGK